MTKQSPTYNSWRSMVQRCTNPNHMHYNRYSKLGIDVKWLSFSNFLEDMGERPERTSLDRIDNESGYYKENCKWSTHTEQCRNRRNGIMTDNIAKSILQLRELGYLIKDIAKELGLNRSTVTNVVYRGDRNEVAS